MVLGVDLGTSSIKLLLLDTKGNILDSSSASYPFIQDGLNSEQDPLLWWNGFCSCLKDLEKRIDLSKIEGISFSGQMHGLVILDENDEVIRPCILWNDGRTSEECKYLNEVIGKDFLMEHTGNIALVGFTAPKLLYLKNKEKENFAKIHKIMLPKDYLIYRLTGKFVSDVSDASGTLLFDVKNRKWSKEMLDIVGISQKQLSYVLESCDYVSTPLNSVSSSLHLSPSLKVFVGGGDQAMNALGTGTIDAHHLSISLGTSGVLFFPLKSFPKVNKGNLHLFCDGNKNYHQMAVTLSCALSFKWWIEDILHSKNYDEIFTNALNTPKNELIFLPYLLGERSPLYEPRIRGLFYGLDSNTSSLDMTRAVLEGVAFSLKDCLNKAKINIKSYHVRIVGGGSKSTSFISLLSNVLGVNIYTINTSEGGAFGAGLLSLVGLHYFNSIEDATKQCIRDEKEYLYDEKEYEYYENKFKKYRKYQKMCLKSITE